MNPYPWRLETYFFPHQEVRANPEHDPNGTRPDNRLNTSSNLVALEGRPEAVGIEAYLSLNEGQSQNPPYFFTINAFGVLTTDLEITDQLRAQAAGLGFHLLIGAIRERLATLTSRAPWGTFILPPIPLTIGPPPSGTAPPTP